MQEQQTALPASVGENGRGLAINQPSKQIIFSVCKRDKRKQATHHFQGLLVPSRAAGVSTGLPS
jgi:hypothetical protein